MAPNFLLGPMGSTDFMRLSLKKGAHKETRTRGLSRGACRKFGVFASPAPACRGAYIGRRGWAQLFERFS
jgi:hypothetical protein